jgi:hypothetical protein
MSADKLIGTWKLVSATYRRPNGELMDYMGEHPLGALMYDERGNMSVQLMRQGRPAFASNDRLGGTPAEAKAAIEGYLAYFGKYTVDEKNKTVTHHIEGCTFPNWVGVDQKRFFEHSDDHLILRTPTLVIRGGDAIGEIIWRRDS